MKKVLLILLAIVLLLVAFVLLFFSADGSNPYQKTSWGRFSGSCDTKDLPAEDYGKDYASCDQTVPEEVIPKFSELDLTFVNEFDGKRSLPLMGSCLIDLNNDGVDELFLGGGVDQDDQIFKYTGDGFKALSESWSMGKKRTGTTYGAVSVDLDKNGFTDLILNGDQGIFWYKNDGKNFTVERISVPLNEKSVPASLSFGDINHDGHLDMFVSAYIKLDQMEGQTIFKDFNYGGSSLLMINNGANKFVDVTDKMGLSYIHNTFMGIFIDVDMDGYLDLVVAHDTGEVRTYKNEGGNNFTMQTNPTTGKFAYPMGIAVGDYNNDTNTDFFFSNTGSSVPEFLARGDLDKDDEFNPKWILFQNNGAFSFRDVATQTKVADFEFSWGAIFEDFNLDGLQDLVVAENYVAFPPHKLFKLPCRFLVQRPTNSFSAVEEQAGVVNKNYAITPLCSDFNQDGYPDLVYANINGGSKAYINSGGESNFIAFRFKETAENIGSKIILTLKDGKTLSDDYVIGEGLASDQTSTLTFGLGLDSEIKNILWRKPTGQTETLSDFNLNQVNLIR